MPQRAEQFELTRELITLLRASWVNERLSECEYGAAEIDPKRPYGNSDVDTDIARVLGWAVGCDGLSEDERGQARELHAQTPTALQVVLSTGQFTPGVYRRTQPYGKDWELVSLTTGYVTLTEVNEHEGETWRFYIPTAGNEAALTALADALANRGDEDDEPGYQLELDCVLPEHEVNILTAHTGGGYMADHQKLTGTLTLTPEVLAQIADPESDHEPLYKGGIRELVK